MKKITPIIIFIMLVILMDIFPLIPIALFKLNINNFSETMKITYNFCTDIGFIIIIYTLYRYRIKKELKDYIINFKDNINLSIKYYIIGLIIMIISNNIINIFFSSATATNENMVRLLIDKYPLYMLFSVAIYAPIVEETIFRRSIKDITDNTSNDIIKKYSYIIISGFIFGAMHVLGTATNIIDYIFIIPYMALGSSFAALYYKTDNLFNTITLHSFHNLLAIILYFIFGG